MPYLSSLPAWLDIEDWLDEDLPTAVAHLAAAVPGRVTSLDRFDGYPSVASNADVDEPERGRVHTLVTDVGEYLGELMDEIEISAGLAISRINLNR